ncbi:uncharacterized protein BT62DRAFT_1013337 [Guyanagaster necrorhizus]|uniref:Uncharacterized protein n=1 Tax=Guyanagaster necrorhizus TaxID=856835 RepID=A0A9P7VFA9_9AGAR|nr:uncharacterized protein BT62DRAFT_1013337 [Guyanagaster necrorhizus MCA 3950]KAG7439888.1 hypothetical protein BT62DRAFT_1013337 [Guyanagaster necrorhizus MCA 3950]
MSGATDIRIRDRAADILTLTEFNTFIYLCQVTTTLTTRLLCVSPSASPGIQPPYLRDEPAVLRVKVSQCVLASWEAKHFVNAVCVRVTTAGSIDNSFSPHFPVAYLRYKNAASRNRLPPLCKIPAGSRVFFYASNGKLVRGVVESTNRMADGTQMVLVKRDDGGSITLPAASVFSG